jgi:RNA recognition motif-containing protein
MKNIFVGGLPADIQNKDLEERFCRYGKINKIEIAKSQFDGSCRGFAHLSIDLDDANWNKLRSTFNGSLWKGKKVKIEESKPNFLDILQTERETQVSLERKPLKKNKPLRRHSKNKDLVNEDNVSQRKGWIRGKLGRPVAVIKIRMPDRKIVTIDPAHHKEAYQRFYFGDKFLSVKYLRWNIEDFDQKTLEKGKHSIQDCMHMELEKSQEEKKPQSQESKFMEEIEEFSAQNDKQIIKNESILTSFSSSSEKEKATPPSQANQKAKLKEIFTAPRYETTFKLFPDEESEEISTPVLSPIAQAQEQPKIQQPQIKPFFTNRPFFISFNSIVAPFMRTSSLEELEQLLAHRRENIYDGIKRMHKNARRQAQSESQNPLHLQQPTKQ